MKVHGEIIKAESLVDPEVKEMYKLMDTYYDRVTYIKFISDLTEKDFCILLKDEDRKIQGFSTQKIISFPLNGKEIHGVFSGDTIIHKDYWGTLELYKLFARNYIKYNRKHPEFFWFLLSKGYKTYKMLPLFFKTFYPNYIGETPVYEKQVIDAFGLFKYPGSYNKETGIIEYEGGSDSLKEGVADITPKRLKNKNIQFFVRSNPGYITGDDFVCIADLNPDNLKPATLRILMGEK